MLTELINYWNIFFFINENNNNEEYKKFISKNKINIEKLINILINTNSLTDNSIKEYCSSIIERIKQKEFFINLINNQKNSIKLEKIKVNKLPKNSIKEKIKNKFKQKSVELDKIYNIESVKNEKKIYDSCIYCLKQIEDNNINNLYGKLGYIIQDYLFSNSFYQTIQKEYFKYNKNKSDFYKHYKKINKKKGFNIYSCNHLIHNICYLKLLENSTDRKCPLCHQNFNIFIPSFSQYKSEELLYALKGYHLLDNSNEIFTIENNKDNNKFIICLNKEEKNNIQKLKENKHFLINKLIKTSKELLYYFIQNNFSFDDFNIHNTKSITINIIEICSESMSNLFDFIENYNNRKIKIEYYKNLILTIRLLMKLEELDYQIAFNILVKLLKKLSILDSNFFCEIIFEDNLKKILSKILFLICILFDYEIIKGYEKYIMKIIINLYSIQYFIRYLLLCNGMKIELTKFSNFNNYMLNEFLKSNKNIKNIIKNITKNIMLTNLIIKYNNNYNNNDDITFDDLDSIFDSINLSNYKSAFFSDIISKLNSIEKQKSKNNFDLFFEQFFPKTKLNDFFSGNYFKVITNYININYNKYISPFLLCSCLPIEYKFTILPSIAIDFQYIFFDFPCIYCKQIGYPSFICLTCGKKICNIKKNKCRAMNPIIEHNEKCGGGRSIFINTFNYTVVLVENNNRVYKSDIHLYVNKFGESIENNTTNKTIKLNKEEIKNALRIFINFSWTNNIP